MSTVLASGADQRYGDHLLNLIGSVKANSDLFDRVVVYDLGLSTRQRRLVNGVRDIEVRTVPPFVRDGPKAERGRPGSGHTSKRSSWCGSTQASPSSAP